MTDRNRVEHVLGIDLSDKKFDFCLLDDHGEVEGRGKYPLTKPGLRKVLDRKPMRVILETGTHSPCSADTVRVSRMRRLWPIRGSWR